MRSSHLHRFGRVLARPPVHTLHNFNRGYLCMSLNSRNFATTTQATATPPQQPPPQTTTQYDPVYPDDDDPLNDEYIPEVDWDHTRFEEHYERIFQVPQEPPTLREKIYDRMLSVFVYTAIAVAVGALSFGIFAYTRMRRQLRYVNRTQKELRKIRPIFEGKSNLIPMDIGTLSLQPLKEEIFSIADENHNLSVDTLRNESETWKKLHAEGLGDSIDILVNFEETGTVAASDVVFFLGLMQYFLAQSRRTGTPSVRRQVRDDLYKLIASYEDDGHVRLRHLGGFASACFSLAIISPPNLGNERIGGQTLEEFKTNYVRYMLRDDDLVDDSDITLRKFNFLYKVCDFGIGLTPEMRGQLAK